MAALLYPFTWAHTYIPVVPECLLDTVCCPTPFMVGIQMRHLERVLEQPMEEVFIAARRGEGVWLSAGFSCDPELVLGGKQQWGGAQRMSRWLWLLSPLFCALFQALIVDLCKGKILRAVGFPAQDVGLRDSTRKGPFPTLSQLPLGGRAVALALGVVGVTIPGGAQNGGRVALRDIGGHVGWGWTRDLRGLF